MSLNRRAIKRAITAGALAIILPTAWAAHAQSVLRLVPQADLKILDTVQTTNNITSNHGYMIYDTLFSLDSKLVPKPQMVESYTRSADGLTWSFKLRPGLKFHDGQPVTSKDVVASILRFSKRIPAGVTMMQFTKEIVATGPDTFEIRLNKPFGLVLETLAGPENPLFITREADALGDPNTAITTAIGSGPFIFVREEWVPGSKVVYKKNPDYKPRADPPDGFAGGKLAKVDRVEWLVIPDSNTAVQALIKGEVDIIEIPQTDLLPLIRKDPNISGQGDRSRRHAGDLPDESPDPAVQQRQGAPGAALRDRRPEGLSRVDDRLTPSTSARAGRCSSAARRSRRNPASATGRRATRRPTSRRRSSSSRKPATRARRS